MTGDRFILHDAVSVSVQLRTLERLRSRVTTAAAAGICPVVEIDLDLCAVRPATRTTSALAAVGTEFSIDEFQEPELLPALPGYSDEAWLSLIRQLDLPSRYPQWSWVEGDRAVRPDGSPFARFHELYWSTELLAEDEPTPGLGLFTEKVESLGGCVVFLSGRWLDEQIEPSLACLRRAGIQEPKLLIGNPWHETLVLDRNRSLSDSALKAWRQAEVRRRWGCPVAIIDDRETNRLAVLAANEQPVESVGIAIPGFTVDPIIDQAPLRLSTFEDFSQTIDGPPLRSHVRCRYPGLGNGMPWNGLYSGLGRNGLPYHLPRLVATTSPTNSKEAPFGELLRGHENLPLTEEAFLAMAERTIPPDECGAMQAALNEAHELAGEGLAAAWPTDSLAPRRLWFNLVCAWLHSRDIEVLMHALGYSIKATGIHDLREWVDAAEIRELVVPKSPTETDRATRSGYSEWIQRWARQLSNGVVNVGFLNPALLVSLREWTPHQDGPQDAMDVHRLSDHHEGDRGERFDPIEAGINNLLHQREGSYGVRKEPVVSWSVLRERVRSESGATALAKNSVARQAVRDACVLAHDLETLGQLTPWGLCCPEG